jgi:hypothetical protein
MRTLVIHGNWLLKKSHFTNLGMKVQGGDVGYRGGVIGFMEKVREILMTHLIDKIVVVWDGAMDGLHKYDRYPVLKAQKQSSWESKLRISKEELFSLSKSELHERSISEQRAVLQEFLEMINVRQIDDETSEATDGICLYINEAITVGESIIVFGREHEFFQLISEDVSTMKWDGTLVTKSNFFQLYAYDNSNDLMIRCFTGMPSGVVSGIKGLTLKKMLHYFSGLKLEHYSYADLTSYARRKRMDVKLKVYELILSAHDIVVRNSRLLNMKDPFFSSELNEQKNYCLYSPLNSDKLDEFEKRYRDYIPRDHPWQRGYFDQFRRVILKEQEYTLFHKQVNI